MFFKFGKLYNCQAYNYDGVEVEKNEEIWKSPTTLQSLEGLNITKSHEDNTIIGKIDRVFTRFFDLGVFALMCFEDEYLGLIGEDTGLSLEYISQKSVSPNGNLSFTSPQFLCLALSDNPRGIDTFILTDSAEDESTKVRERCEFDLQVVTPTIPGIDDTKNRIEELQQQITSINLSLTDKISKLESRTTPTFLVSVPEQQKQVKKEVFKKW
jgi:hypothetical protein